MTPLAPTVDLSPAHRLWRRRVFTATWLSYFGFYFTRKAWGVCKKDIQQAFDWDTTQIAHIGTAFLVAYMVGQFLAGSLGRRYGTRAILLVGMTVSLVANAAFGFSSSFVAFLTFMVLNGLSQATGWPGNIGILARWYRKEERGTVMGLWSTCYSVGSGVAKTFAALLLGLKLGWPVAFFGCSAVLLVCAAVFALWERDDPQAAGLSPLVEQDAAPDPAAAVRAGFADFLSILGNPSVLIMGATYFCIKFLRYALDSWLPYFFSAMGMQSSNAGIAASAFDYAGIAGTFLAGWLSDRYFTDRRSVVSAGMAACMVAALAAVLLAPPGVATATALIALYGATGFFLYGPDSLLSGVGAVDVSDPRNAVAAAGIINGLGSIGPIFQEELIGWLYQRTNADLAPGVRPDLGAINALLTGIAAAALVLLIVLARREAARARAAGAPA